MPRHSFSILSPPKPTDVFDTFWRFAAERQKIFFARFNQCPEPWTNDPILREFKFTNAFRASDRVSQYLIRNVIYRGSQEPSEIFFRILLFKLFNKIQTWELLEKNVGVINSRSFSFKEYDQVLSQALQSGRRIYSPAYIMASGHKLFNVKYKHQSHLKLVELMMSEELPEKLIETKRMFEGFELLRGYPLIGDFLAYQIITDINYSVLTEYSEIEFTKPGPGASDGIRKCFSELGELSESDVIRWVMERQEKEFDRVGVNFLNLWGRELQLIDIQNLFCEVGKYARVKHPEVQGISGRTRIKQKFYGNQEVIKYYYPPKWQINEKIIKNTEG